MATTTTSVPATTTAAGTPASTQLIQSVKSGFEGDNLGITLTLLLNFAMSLALIVIGPWAAAILLNNTDATSKGLAAVLIVFAILGFLVAIALLVLYFVKGCNVKAIQFKSPTVAATPPVTAGVAP